MSGSSLKSDGSLSGVSSSDGKFRMPSSPQRPPTMSGLTGTGLESPWRMLGKDSSGLPSYNETPMNLHQLVPKVLVGDMMVQGSPGGESLDCVFMSRVVTVPTQSSAIPSYAESFIFLPPQRLHPESVVPCLLLTGILPDIPADISGFPDTPLGLTKSEWSVGYCAVIQPLTARTD